ncbi:hypothetical protein AAF712_016405, partial [Marasmius tenuissimus]
MFEDRQALILALRSSLRPDLEESTVHSPSHNLDDPPKTTRQHQQVAPPPLLPKETGILLADDSHSSNQEDAPPPKRKKPMLSRPSNQPANAAGLAKAKNLANVSNPPKKATGGRRSSARKKTAGNQSANNKAVVEKSPIKHDDPDASAHSEPDLADQDVPMEEDAVGLLADVNQADWKAFLEWQEHEKTAAEDQLKAERRKEAYEKRKAERNVEKSAVWDAVTANRTTKSLPAVETVNAHKRPASGEEKLVFDWLSAIKKAKRDNKVGGLCTDYQQVIIKESSCTQPKDDVANSDQDRKVDSDSDSSEPELVGGIFNEDEAPDAVAVARKSKVQGKKDIQSVKANEGLPVNPVLTSLVAADVNIIDSAERQSTPLMKTSLPRQVTSIKSLPFPFPTNDFTFYKKKWNESIMPQILHHIESEAVQFTIGNDPELVTFVKGKWKDVLPELKDKSKNKEIMQFVRAELWQYWSGVGKGALKIVARKIEEAGDTIEERADWVKKELHNDRFVFATPGETYKRALKIYKPGYNCVDQEWKDEKEKCWKEGNMAKLRRRDRDAFTEDLWCNPVKFYHDTEKGGLGKV